ncbi:AsmA-like C-terminal region-containing protein [Aminivibrio sp.]
MKKNKMLIAVFAVLALAGVLLIGASMDFGGPLVVSKAREAVRELLGAELSVGEVRGNPIKGYTLEDVAIVKGKKTLLAAGYMGAKVRVASLLSGSPKLQLLSLGKVNLDADRVAAQVAAMDFAAAGGGDMPVEKVMLENSTISSRWVTARVNTLGLSFSGKTIASDMDMTVNAVPVKGKISAVLDGSIVTVTALDLAVGEGKLSATGKVAPELDVTGEAEGLDLKELIAFWPVVPPEGFEGKVSASFTGKGQWNSPALAGTVDYSGKALLGYPVESVKGKWAFAEKKLSVTDLDARVLSMPLQGRMTLAMGKEAPEVDLVLSGTKIDIGQLNQLYPQLADVSGEVDKFTISLAGTSAKLDGVVEFSAPTIRAYGYTVSNTAAQVKVSPKEARVSGKSSFEGAPVTLQGTVNDYMSAPKLNLTANIRSFNLSAVAKLFPQMKELAPEGKANGDFVIKGTAASPQISGKIWSDKLTVKTEVLENPVAVFAMKGEQVALERVSALVRGTPLSASGTYGPDRKLNLTVSIEKVQPGALAAFLPAMAGYDLKGTVSGQGKITGTTASPKIDLNFSSPSLGVAGLAAFKDLKGETSLAGDMAAMGKADLDLVLSAGSATVMDLALSNLAGKIKKTGSTLNITSLTAASGKGSLSGAGTVTLPAGQNPGAVDLTIAVKGADLAALSSAAGTAMPLGGAVDGTIAVKGPLTNPSVNVQATSPRVSVAGMAGTDVALALTGSAERMTIDSFSASFGGGTLSGTGTAELKGAPVVTVDLAAKDLDLKALTSGMKDAAALGISGRVNGSFKGRFAGTSGKGEGVLTSPEITARGLKMTNISAPLVLDGTALATRGATGTFYGGTIRSKETLNLDTFKFTENLTFEGVDVNAVLQAYTGGLDGSVTGRARGEASLSGSLTPNMTYSGKGKATIGSGTVSGFRGLQVATALYGTSGVRYERVVIPFTLGTGKITLEKGTEATAPANDRLYTYLTAQGPVGPKGALDLQAAGNVNIQVLNALAGGAIGGLTAGSLEDALRGILGGAQQGLEKADFRDISFRIGGTVDDPKMSNLKVAPGAAAPQGTPAAPAPVQPPKSIEQKVLDQIIKPNQPAPAPAQPPAPAPAPAPVPPPETSPVNPPQQEEPKKPEDYLKEKLLDAIFK